MQRLALSTFAVLLASCATMRVYQLPLTPSEGQAMVPALISASQQQALESFRGPNGAVTTLEDGTQLSWQNSANDQEHQARFVAAKARADQLWNLAMASRSMLMPPPTVVVAPQPVAPAPAAVETTTTTISVPGASISVSGAVMPSTSVTVTDTGAAASGSSSASCCVNGAGYSCPSAAAVDRCSGAFMRCMQACNFTCERRCQRDTPLDPSGCTRNTSLDATCR